MWPPQHGAEGKDHVPPPSDSAFPNAARDAVCLATRVRFWLGVRLIQQDPMAIPAELLPRCGTGHFLVLNPPEFLVGSFLQPVSHPFEWQQNHLAYHPLLPLLHSLQTCPKFAEGALCLTGQAANEDVKQHWSLYWPWGTALVTGLQLDFVLLEVMILSPTTFLLKAQVPLLTYWISDYLIPFLCYKWHFSFFLPFYFSFFSGIYRGEAGL